ncbi:MAG: TerD family protein [Clostridioides sp.]|jgi:stress response protein SCP2|nr:TerD family protein [Clostridioides sp.]
MAINLQKGQKIDLKKSNPGLSKILVGLGWDPVSSGGGGFLSSLFGVGQADIDCDASVFMLNKDGKLESTKDLIYFGNLKSENKSVVHTGDNITGEGDGDDEELLVDLDKIPSKIENLIFTVNIYKAFERKQHFGMIKNAFIRVVDRNTNKEIVRYNLSDNYSEKTALIVGNIKRENGSWDFKAIGDGYRFKGLNDILSNLNKIQF